MKKHFAVPAGLCLEGHGIKAEDHLREAERELHLAVEAAKAHR